MVYTRLYNGFLDLTSFSNVCRILSYSRMSNLSHPFSALLPFSHCVHGSRPTLNAEQSVNNTVGDAHLARSLLFYIDTLIIIFNRLA